MFISPPTSIHGESQEKKPINRPPPKHPGVNIPGVSYPPNSGSIQDIISHHTSQNSEGNDNHNNRGSQNIDRRYDRYNSNTNRNTFNSNNGKQNFRAPIRDLTKPPPIIIGKTTERPFPDYGNTNEKKYNNHPYNNNKLHVIPPPVSPEPPYHNSQNYGQNNYERPSNDGIDRYDGDVGYQRPHHIPTNGVHKPNLFDTHNRVQPIIIDDFSAPQEEKVHRRQSANAKDYNNRRIDANPHNYNGGTSLEPINAIDPNDYKFYSFVTESPGATVNRRPPQPTTTKRTTYYTPTRPTPAYTTRKRYTYKPYQVYPPTSKPTTIPPYSNDYGSDK